MTTSSVPRPVSVTSQPAGGVVVHQPPAAAAAIRVGSVVAAPRTAAITQPTLPLAAAVCFQFCPQHAFIASTLFVWQQEEHIAC